MSNTKITKLGAHDADADCLTVLRCRPPHVATKTHLWSGSSWETIAFNAGYEFVSMTIPVTCLADFAEKLKVIEANYLAFLIRGLPLPHVKRNEPHRRLKRDQADGEKATYRSPEKGHFYSMVDIDISQLPEEFADVSYYWQLSSSAGLRDQSTISAHLFFWSSVRLTDDELKRWGKHVNQQRGFKLIDCALFNDVQSHFIAKPIFVGGNDPFPIRSGLTTKGSDSVEMVIPDIVDQPRPTSRNATTPSSGMPSAGHGVDHWLAQIGDHAGGDGFNGPIIRAIASYVSLTSLDEIDREGLKATIRQRICETDSSMHTQSYLEEKMSDHYLDSAIDGAIHKFGNRRIKPGIQPFYKRAPISASDASAKLIELIRDFFKV
jgi:hypothetical protein